MNKKVLMLAISILTISITITPMIGTAQAWGWGSRSRKIETFYVEPFVDPPTLSNTIVLAEGNEKCVKHDTVKIVWGEIKKSNKINNDEKESENFEDVIIAVADEQRAESCDIRVGVKDRIEKIQG